MRIGKTPLISENTVPDGVFHIAVFDGDKKVGTVDVDKMRLPSNIGEKLYSFGALSDVHVTNSTLAMTKFRNALTYFNDAEKVKFTCISGDLTSSGTADQFTSYRNAVASYSPNVPIYNCTGNHDVQNTEVAPFTTLESTIPYTGQPLYYSFTQGDDVFIMFGMRGWSSYTGNIFYAEALQWLYETLEENRNKRCFVFEHCPHMVWENGVVSECSSGAIPGLKLPTGNLLNGDGNVMGDVFRSLVKHYKNVLWFHGHTHMEFDYQTQWAAINYENKFARHSIHIPSSIGGRTLKSDGTGWQSNTIGSYGYVVDVYANHVVLRGRNFDDSAFEPLAMYCLDTAVIEMPEKSFTDGTGTITP